MSCWFQLYRATSRLFNHSGYTEVFSLRWTLVKMDPKCRTGTKNLSDFWAHTSSFCNLCSTILVCWGTRAYAVVFAVSLHQQLVSPFVNSNSIWKGSHKANAVWRTNKSRADQNNLSTCRGKQNRPPSAFLFSESSAPASWRVPLLTSQFASIPEGQPQPGSLLPISSTQGVKRGAAVVTGQRKRKSKAKITKLKGN